jgi:hypothetical protein
MESAEPTIGAGRLVRLVSFAGSDSFAHCSMESGGGMIRHFFVGLFQVSLVLLAAAAVVLAMAN